MCNVKIDLVHYMQAMKPQATQVMLCIYVMLKDTQNTNDDGLDPSRHPCSLIKTHFYAKGS